MSAPLPQNWREIQLIATDFVNVPLVQVLSSASKRACEYYTSPLLRKAEEAESAGDQKAEAVYRILALATMLNFRADSREQPFRPQEWLDQISSTYLDLFAELVPVQGPSAIADPELRARLADLIWIRRHPQYYQRALIAIDSYRDSSKILDTPDTWILAVERLQRALNLGANIGRPAAHFPPIVSEIEGMLSVHASTDDTSRSAFLMQMLLDQGLGNAQVQAPNAAALARRVEAIARFDLARRYWQLAATWYRQGSDLQNQESALLAAAETYVTQAQLATQESPPNYGKAEVLLQQGIVALRRLQGTQLRVSALHHQLLAYQAQAVTQMTVISVPYNQSMTEQMENKARQAVAGRSLQDALLAMAIELDVPINKAKLRSEVTSFLQMGPLSVFFGGFAVDATGRHVALHPGLETDNPENQESVIRRLMFEEAFRHQHLMALATIIPAINQLTLEHRVSRADLLDLIADSPFIPSGREGIYARGLQAGLDNDWLVAAHLLIPQIEESLRHVLRQSGTLVIGLEDAGLQQYHLLGSVLERPELERILGPDVVFDLQGLLQDEQGSNLRNLMAHGLLEENQFASPQVVYLWWLTLHLCCRSQWQSIVPAVTPAPPSSPTTPTVAPSSGTGNSAATQV